MCAREQRVTVFGEVYDAKLAFLFTQSQDQLFSVAILKFFFSYCGYLLINVEWANERTLLHKCGFHMQAKIIFVIWEYKIRALIWRMVCTFLLITCICKLRVSWLIALPIWFSPDYHPHCCLIILSFSWTPFKHMIERDSALFNISTVIIPIIVITCLFFLNRLLDDQSYPHNAAKRHHMSRVSFVSAYQKAIHFYLFTLLDKWLGIIYQ